MQIEVNNGKLHGLPRQRRKITKCFAYDDSSFHKICDALSEIPEVAAELKCLNDERITAQPQEY